MRETDWYVWVVSGAASASSFTLTATGSLLSDGQKVQASPVLLCWFSPSGQRRNPSKSWQKSVQSIEEIVLPSYITSSIDSITSLVYMKRARKRDLLEYRLICTAQFHRFGQIHIRPSR